MALVTAHFTFPDRPSASASAPTYGNLTIDAAGEKAALILKPPKLGNVHKILFRTGTVTTGDTVDVRIETVDAAGDPTGTLWATNTNASQVIADANDNLVFVTTLTADAALVDFAIPFAVVIANGALPGAINLSTLGIASQTYPYSDLFTASWSHGQSALVIGLEYDDGSYEIIPNIYPATAINVTGFASGSTPDERGNVIIPPFKLTTNGAWIWVDLDGDATIVLYDTDGVTPLAQSTLDKDHRGGLSGATHNVIWDDGPVTLDAGSTYRLVARPAASNIVFYDLDFNSAALLNALPGKQSIYATSAKDPSGVGSWTDVTTKRAMIGLLVSEVDDGTGAGGGSGGLISHAGMTGGLSA